MDEYLDLVDKDDKVIDRKLRSEVYSRGLNNFRVVNAFIVNSQGELWIPRRSENKRVYPLCLDTSMGGHVESGESYEQAFIRELEEELNIKANKKNTLFKGHLNPHSHSVSAFMNVYEIKSNKTPKYNKNDFTEHFWLTPSDAIAKIAKDKAKSDLPKLIEHFYLIN